MSPAIERKEVKKRRGEAESVPEERRCTHVHADGKRCKQRRWREKELCFHHDPEAAELRKHRGVPVSELRMMSKTEVHALLTKAIEDLQGKRISPGEAYALGYLAQLVLANYKAMADEYDWVKSNWDRWQEIRWRLLALDEGKYEEKVLGQTSEEQGEDGAGEGLNAESVETETGKDG